LPQSLQFLYLDSTPLRQYLWIHSILYQMGNGKKRLVVTVRTMEHQLSRRQTEAIWRLDARRHMVKAILIYS